MKKLFINKVTFVFLITFYMTSFLYSSGKYVEPKLPTLTKGLWAGYNSVYIHSKFDALLTPRGYFNIYLKGKDGKYVNKKHPITYGGLGFSYYKKGMPQAIGRRRVKYTKFPKPSATSRKSVVIEGVAEDGLTFYYKIDFKNNIIESTFSFKDPRDIGIPTTNCASSISIPRSYDIPNDVPQTERIKILKKSKLTTRQKVPNKKGKLKSKSVRYPYYDVLRFKGTVEKAIVAPESWAPRKLTIDPKRATRMWGSIYPGFCPWEGFWFGFNAFKLGKAFSMKLKID